MSSNSDQRKRNKNFIKLHNYKISDKIIFKKQLRSEEIAQLKTVANSYKGTSYV